MERLVNLVVEELEERIAPGALGDVPSPAEGIAGDQMAWTAGLFAGQPGGAHSHASAIDPDTGDTYAHFISAATIGGQATGGTGTLNQHFPS